MRNPVMLLQSSSTGLVAATTDTAVNAAAKPDESAIADRDRRFQCSVPAVALFWLTEPSAEGGGLGGDAISMKRHTSPDFSLGCFRLRFSIVRVRYDDGWVRLVCHEPYGGG